MLVVGGGSYIFDVSYASKALRQFKRESTCIKPLISPRQSRRLDHTMGHRWNDFRLITMRHIFHT